MCAIQISKEVWVLVSQSYVLARLACLLFLWNACGMQEADERAETGVAPTVQFIDFEYGAFGFRGFDWGNHFNEWAGFECDYSRYPKPPAAAAFLHAYLAEGAASPPVRCTSMGSPFLAPA